MALVFLMAGTLLTTTVVTIVPAAYAEEYNDDGNQQKAEDDSSAGIADCDRNNVEAARFLCFAIAANDVEIEQGEESAKLSVCKDANDVAPEDFEFTVTGNNPSPAQFAGDPNCVDVTIGPGEYAVSEVGPPVAVETDIIDSDCVQDPNDQRRATGEIQAGETQVCTFFNFGTI